MLRLVSQHLVIEMNPAHGAEVHSLIDRATGKQLLWCAPWEPEPPRSGPLSVEVWTNQYRGGWQECFPNAGNACTVDDRYHGFHGEASNSPWEVLSAQENTARLRWSDGELVLERHVLLAAHRAAVYYEERVKNVGSVPRSFIWVHHPALGGALIDPACVIDIPAKRAYPLDEEKGPVTPPAESTWPLVVGEDWSRAALSEPMVRFGCVTDLDAGWAALRNDTAGIGIALCWPLDIFPHLWLYQDIHAVADKPWEQRGEFVMLEPSTTPHSLGLATALAHGQAFTLAPGELLASWLTVSVFRPNGTVLDVASDGTVTPELSA